MALKPPTSIGTTDGGACLKKIIAALDDKDCVPHESGSGWSALCPAHEDHNPSLSISEGQDGRVLLKCHAGCGTEAVVEALDRTMGDLFPAKNSRTATVGQIINQYDYQDEAGHLHYQVLRYEPKGFRQRRPDGAGGWTWSIAGVPRVLYRLPAVIAAVESGKPIYFCEGEKDVDAMEAHGFVATCNSGGAMKDARDKKWPDTCTESLRGADVVIVADKDSAGRNHAQVVVAKLAGIAKSIRVIELPDHDGITVKDASDWFVAGGTADEFTAIVADAPVIDADTAAAASSTTGSTKGTRSYKSGSTAEAYLGGEQPSTPTDAAALPDLIDAAAFIAQPIAPPPELVAGVLHLGSKLVLGGSSKSFKTWTLLDLGIAVATGTDWLGHLTVQGKVLFVNFEIQPHAWQCRIVEVAKAKGVTIEAGQITLWNLRGHAADFRQLIPKIIERCRAENFALIVLDPIYKLYGNTDENSAGNVALLLNALEQLATETGAAIAFGAHFAKGNAAGKEAIDRISGSGVFARDPDSLLIFTKHETEDAFTVEPILRNFAPVKPFVVRWKFPLMQRDDELDPHRLKQAGGRPTKFRADDLLALLPPEGLATRDWLTAAAAKNISARTYYRLRSALESSGKVLGSVAGGRWTPVLPKIKP